MYKIAVLPGDGVGPEIVAAAVRVMNAVGHRFGHDFQYFYGLIGGASLSANGVPLTEGTVKICRECDAVLLGAVGDPAWDYVEAARRPEQAILGLRKELQLFANLRPVFLFDALLGASTFKPEVIKDIDLLVVRELTGGIYFGQPRQRENTPQGVRAYDTMAYYDYEIERIAKVAFNAARQRRSKVTVVDKANVLESSRLWREVVTRVHADYPDVALDFMYVDTAAMQLIRNPGHFDVLLTENLFGDILSDEASMLTGSLGMLPSASFGATKPALYEPIHGSAPDIAGQNKANPIATIMSAAMLLKYSLNLVEEAEAIQRAVARVLANGYRTADIMEEGKIMVGTERMSKLIAAEIVQEIKE